MAESPINLVVRVLIAAIVAGGAACFTRSLFFVIVTGSFLIRYGLNGGGDAQSGKAEMMVGMAITGVAGGVIGGWLAWKLTAKPR